MNRQLSDDQHIQLVLGEQVELWVHECVSFIQEKIKNQDFEDFTPDWDEVYLKDMQTTVFPDRLLREMKHVVGVPIWLCKHIDKNDEYAKAMYNGVTIRMLKNMPQALKTHVLLHEWAHVVLHTEALLEDSTPEEEEAFLSYAEIEAELTAALIQQVIGNDSWNYSKLYICDWWMEHTLGHGGPVCFEKLVNRVMEGATVMLQALLDVELIELDMAS